MVDSAKKSAVLFKDRSVLPSAQPCADYVGYQGHSGVNYIYAIVRLYSTDVPSPTSCETEMCVAYDGTYRVDWESASGGNQNYRTGTLRTEPGTECPSSASNKVNLFMAISGGGFYEFYVNCTGCDASFCYTTGPGASPVFYPGEKVTGIDVSYGTGAGTAKLDILAWGTCTT